MASARYGLDNPKKALLLDWLLDPIPGALDSVQKWAEANGVNPTSARRWKQEPAFRRAWETELAKRNVDPGRVQKVIDAMFRKAADGDTVAAKLVMEYVGRLAPQAGLEAADDASDLSDEELEREYQQALAAEVERRQGSQ